MARADYARSSSRVVRRDPIDWAALKPIINEIEEARRAGESGGITATIKLVADVNGGTRRAVGR